MELAQHKPSLSASWCILRYAMKKKEDMREYVHAVQVQAARVQRLTRQIKELVAE